MTATATLARRAATAAWQPVHIPETPCAEYHGWQGCTLWNVYPAADPDAVALGWLRVDDNGQWNAHGTHRGSRSAMYPTRRKALEAMGWLDTVPAAAFDNAAWFQAHDVLPNGAYDVRLVLSDGLLVAVDDVPQERHFGRVTLTVYAVGRVPLTSYTPARPLALRLQAVKSGRCRPRVRMQLTVPASAALTLAPPCDMCGASADAGCDFSCDRSII